MLEQLHQGSKDATLEKRGTRSEEVTWEATVIIQVNDDEWPNKDRVNDEDRPEMSVKGRIYRTQGLIQCDRWRRKSVSRLGDIVKPGWKYKEGEFSFGYSHLEEAVNYLGEDRKI